MTENTPRTTIFSLPTELRLQIATHALEQPTNAGFVLRGINAPPIEWLSPEVSKNLIGLVMVGQYTREKYSPAANLSLLLVCRQFRAEFTELAWRSTTFFLGLERSAKSATAIVRRVPEGRLCMLRNVVMCYPLWEHIIRWNQWPFDAECVRLDRLSLIPATDVLYNFAQLVALLRRLRNVKQLKFISQRYGRKHAVFRNWCNRLVGAMMKEDHHQRYDTLNAPHVGDVWWEWSFNDVEKSFLLVAEKPAPVVPEEAYLQFIKPRIDALMADMARQ